MAPVPAALLVFFTSAAVLVLEILAGRLLAPYVGVTLQTYTGIIGVVLAGIAYGSWQGGKMADRIDPRRTLGPTVVLGGILALLSLPVLGLLGEAFRGGGNVAIVVLSLGAFFLPAAVLTAVTPMVIKLSLADLDETGQVVGRLSAIGTAGAIAGVFLTGFVLVAALPSRPIVLGLGIALAVVGGLVWAAIGQERTGRATAGTLSLAVGAALLTALSQTPCDAESAYYCAQVLDDPDRTTGRVLVLDALRHSYVDVEDPTHLEFAYTRLFGHVLDGMAPEGAPLRAVHVGGGGFSMPRYLAATRPGSTSVVLEIDPTLVDLAVERLGFDPDEPGIDVRAGDARLGMARLEDGSADVVIGDAFGGLAVPWHLTTVEFTSDIARVLEDGGLYVLNVIDYPPLDFARAEAATVAAVFDHVALVAPPGRFAGTSGGNVVVVASDAPIDTDDLAARIAASGGDQEIRTGAAVEAFAGDARLLTDDHAPVDQLLTPIPLGASGRTN